MIHSRNYGKMMRKSVMFLGFCYHGKVVRYTTSTVIGRIFTSFDSYVAPLGLSSAFYHPKNGDLMVQWDPLGIKQMHSEGKQEHSMHPHDCWVYSNDCWVYSHYYGC